MSSQELFINLLRAPTENAVDEILREEGLISRADVWAPYGGQDTNYAVVENQQSHSVPALVEKITNGIDAILERHCVEAGIDPRSSDAPRSVEEALSRFFPERVNWDLSDMRREQAQNLQVVADGPRRDTSLLVYDNGIGQRPQDFPTTFLSLLRGNKNSVHFVQGKYNMGGAGAIAFCGSRRYQLIASKRYDNRHPLGFTILRRHPLTEEEAHRLKSTWYEYLIIDGEIPAFHSDALEIGLSGRKFETGSIIKLYSYDLPEGARSIISRDLNLSLNEFLFEPALPFLTVDTAERYPDNRALVTPVYGLKRRLEGENELVETHFTQVSESVRLGKLNVTTYVFKARARGDGVKETKTYIRREFFKNNMTVLFSLNGQVQGAFTSEFVTRTLQLPLLKDYLLIHVDCSELRTEVRNELFMASRDRLKRGEQADELRKHLRDLLLESPLRDIAKRRRASLSVEGADAGQMLREVTRRLPISDALSRLLKQTFDLPDKRQGANRNQAKSHGQPTKKAEHRETPPFKPQRYPSQFRLQGGDGREGELTLFRLPLGGSRTIRFATDVEDQYFTRADDPGSMRLSALRPGGEANNSGGNSQPSELGDVLDVVRSSPTEGQIRVAVKPARDTQVGDAVAVKANLSSAEGDLEQIFLIRIVDPEQPKSKPKEEPEPKLGLPELVLASRNPAHGHISWTDVEAAGLVMNHEIVVQTEIEDDQLAKIIVNMDSSVLLNFNKGLTSSESLEIAEKRYISAIYFHALFLFATTKAKKYELRKPDENNQEESVEISEYISDLFTSSYAQFLLNFDTSDLLAAIA